MPTPAFRPIAATLIRSIFVWASVCALLIGLGQSAFSYLHVQDEFEQELREIADANVPLLSVGLFDDNGFEALERHAGLSGCARGSTRSWPPPPRPC